MIKNITYERIFDLFLESLAIVPRVVKITTGFRTMDKNKDFRLNEKNSSIVYKQKTVRLDGGVYVKENKYFLYFIKEDMGNIYIVDENQRKILTLTDSHCVLKIEKPSCPKTTIETSAENVYSLIQESVHMDARVERHQLSLF